MTIELRVRRGRGGSVFKLYLDFEGELTVEMDGKEILPLGDEEVEKALAELMKS